MKLKIFKKIMRKKKLIIVNRFIKQSRNKDYNRKMMKELQTIKISNQKKKLILKSMKKRMLLKIKNKRFKLLNKFKFKVKINTIKLILSYSTNRKL